jgi:hypothetical protein
MRILFVFFELGGRTVFWQLGFGVSDRKTKETEKNRDRIEALFLNRIDKT